MVAMIGYGQVCPVKNVEAQRGCYAATNTGLEEYAAWEEDPPLGLDSALLNDTWVRAFEEYHVLFLVPS